MNTKLSLCIICKNNDPSERENFPKLIESIEKYVDEICITITHPKGEVVSEEFTNWLKHSVDPNALKVSTFEWCDDFSKARTFNFKQASNELVYWLDMDDVMINGEEIPSLCRRFVDRPDLTAVWITYLYQTDSDGNPAMWVPRERIVKKSIYRWVGKLHENLICRYLPIIDVIDKKICHIKHNIDAKEVEEKAVRNLRIIEKAYKEGHAKKEVDPITVFDLARSYHALAMLPRSKEVFLEFITMTDSNSHMYDSYCRLSDISKSQGGLNEAKGYAMQAINIKHNWPDAYHALAYVAFIEEKYKTCLHWLLVADKLEPPKGVLPHDPTKYQIKPLALGQECYFRMNEPVKALDCAERALALSPSSEPLKASVKMIKHFLHDQDVELSYVTVLGDLVRTGEKLKAKNILECVPSSMEDHPFIVQMKNKYIHQNTTRRVVIYCHESFEHWGPKSVETGIGGSEEAVINISKNLAKEGWSVEVYCDCNDVGIHDGVIWNQFYTYDRGVDCDVFIGWRMNEFISLAPEDSYKILWLHDKQKLDYYKESIVEKIDKIFVLSNYHRKDLSDLPDNKFYVTRNGIDPSQFDNVGHMGPESLRIGPMIPDRFIYASSPDRGLHKVLESWLEIKKINPNAELHIFYGFNKVYDKIQEDDPRRKDFRENVMKLIDQLPDIHYHGRVGHQELADWFMKCGFWLYPCTFDEISPVRGDTLIETPKGKFKIEDLVGKKDFHVYSCDSDGELSLSNVNGVFKTRENAKMLKVTFKRGVGCKAEEMKTLHLTPDHEIMLRDGTYLEAGELKVGDKVKAFHRYKDHWGIGYDMIGLTDKTVKPEHRFVFEKDNGISIPRGYDIDHLDSNVKNNSPENLESKTRSQHWKDTWSRKTSEARKEWADSRAKVLKDYHDSMTKEELSSMKRDAANARWAKSKLSNHIVVSIEESKPSDAYCMEVEPDHNFIANGIVVHNCITAMKAQAAGCWPITNDHAALAETVRYGTVTKGSVEDPVNLGRWVESVRRAMDESTPESRAKMRTWALRHFSWETLAKEWSYHFKTWIDQKEKAEASA